MMMAVDYAVLVVMIKKSSVLNTDAESGLFTAKWLTKESNVGCHFQ